MLYDTQSRAYLKLTNRDLLNSMEAVQQGKDLDFRKNTASGGKMRRSDYANHVATTARNTQNTHFTGILLDSL